MEAIKKLVFARRAALARFVLVVEKDTVFRRLADDGFTRRVPCVLVTASGFPDLCSRAIVQRLVQVLKVPAFAVTDFNPSGNLYVRGGVTHVYHVRSGRFL